MGKRVKTVLLVVILTIAGAVVFHINGRETLNRYNAEFIGLFDTLTQITGYAEDKDKFTEYSQTVHDRLESYHELYDIYNDYEGTNNIKTINDNAGIAPVTVDQKIIDLLLLGREMYEETGGKVNIAFGSVLSIWHTYRTEGLDDPQNAKLPEFEELKEASEHTDIDKVIIDEKNSTVYLEDTKMSLDVGAIAKGYAVERVCEEISDMGIDSMLISVGGNIRAVGSRAKNEKWTIGIQNPDTNDQTPYICKVLLEDMSVVTSGNYQRYYSVDGKKYHHIINPYTLMPENYFEAVSIICNDSGKADAYSTAVFNMPYEEGIEFINSLDNVEAMWVLENGEIRYSKGFESFLPE